MSLTASSLSTQSGEPHQNIGSAYTGGSRARAIATLRRSVHERDVLTLLTGIAGVGKSVVLDAALKTMADEPIRVIRLSNPDSSSVSLRALSGQLLGKPVEALTDLAVAPTAMSLSRQMMPIR